MGPYCKYCGRRCFVPVTTEWPAHIAKAYGTNGLAATCHAGQALERAALGYCWDDVERELLAGTVAGRLAAVQAELGRLAGAFAEAYLVPVLELLTRVMGSDRGDDVHAR